MHVVDVVVAGSGCRRYPALSPTFNTLLITLLLREKGDMVVHSIDGEAGNGENEEEDDDDDCDGDVALDHFGWWGRSGIVDVEVVVWSITLECM